MLTHRPVVSDQMGGIDIEESESLGILVMQNLREILWNKHVFKMSNKFFKYLSDFERSKKFFPCMIFNT